ncbi:MAG TPA: hypothetical protein VFW07_16185 [Parafilimonas sp.]|nr:hypothetical protein [Parafilimonas sp.]
MYFLKLSGYIPKNKQTEFEQTYRLAATQIPRTCEEYTISKDALNEDVYYFMSYWPQPSQLQSFSQSPSFMMLTGAFMVLGELYENSSGEITKNQDMRRIGMVTRDQIN